MRVWALGLMVWLAGCHVDRSFPNARLQCADDSECPGGFSCQAISATVKVCCQGGDCVVPDGGGGGGGGGTVVMGSGGGSGGTVSMGGGGDGGAATCTSECSAGMIRCEAGGGRACKIDKPCAYWGSVDPKNVCSGLQLVDDGLEEGDVSVQCAGSLCLIGGITP